MRVGIVTLALKLLSEANQRGHWSKKAKRTRVNRMVCCVACRVPMQWFTWALAHDQPPVKLVVTITRIAPRRLDDDNAVSACKGPRDGIAEALGVDDRDPRVTWRVEQEKGAPREYAVRIKIEEST